jgi:hypothetical protein
MIDKIHDGALNKHANNPDVPNLSAAELKAFFDQPAEVLMEKINEIIGEDGGFEEIKSLGELTQQFMFLANDVMNNKSEFDDFKLMEFEELKKRVGEQDEAMQAAQEERHAMQNDLEKQKEDNENAKKYVDSLRELELENMRGVYVGEGEMPENCAVQIDPSGGPDTNIGHYVIDHLDLTIEEIRNIYDQCVVGGRPLVVKTGEAVNVCCHIYSNIALNSIAFLYMGLSSGKPCLSRHGYDMVTGSHTASKYYLVKEG